MKGDKRWIAYWKRKAKGCKHVWGQKFRKMKNPERGPLAMCCSECGIPYYRWFQCSAYYKG